MARTLCVLFPDWPLRRSDAPPDKPCFVISDTKVVAANELARGSGISPQMDRREAEGLCPDAVVLERDLIQEQVAFEPVAAAIESLVPRIELVEPGKAFVLLSGAVAYFGGEKPLVDRIVAETTAIAGPGGKFGIARCPFAAEWAAHLGEDVDFIENVNFIENEAEFLASLDIGSLLATELVDTFRWLGIGTLGDLARLPRAAIASRFGTQGLAAHRLASGEDRVPVPREIPPNLAVEERFSEPLLLLSQVGFAARRLTHQLVSGLRSQGVASHRVEIEAASADGTVRIRVWRSADPFNAETLTERVWWQLRAWSESGGVPGGLSRLRIAPADFSGSGRQLDLFENTAASIETERAVARAQSLLGMDAVLGARPQGGRGPSEQVLWYRWGEPMPPTSRDPDAPWPGQTPKPAPALVPPEPETLEVEWDEGIPVRVRLRSRWESVISWAGPWRRVGRWWLGEQPTDRYQLVTSVGALLCEVTKDRAFLVGIYD